MRFTFAKGNNEGDDYDAFVTWDFEDIDGSFVIEVHIPPESATASVTYRVLVDENDDAEFDAGEELHSAPVLVQDEESGWRSLGTIEATGDVRILLYNSETLDDYRDGDPMSARIGVDVIRLRRVEDVENPEPSSTTGTTESISEG